MDKLDPHFELKKYNAVLRLIDLSDAAFIVDLRADEKNARFISQSSKSIIEQEQWVANYKLREMEGTEYYFVVCNNQMVPYGTTRIYNFNNHCFETGSWVFKHASPEYLPILGDIIGREIGFDMLGFYKCNFQVRKGNSKVLRYHKMYNPTLIGEDELNYYFELTKDEFNKHKIKFLKIYGYENR